MVHVRVGTSLAEVLLALVLLSATAAWGLQAAQAAERTLGDAERHRQALHRAQRALADLDAMPCDSINVTRVLSERRWRIAAQRDHDAQAYSDDVMLRPAVGDSLQLHHGGWCD